MCSAPAPPPRPGSRIVRCPACGQRLADPAAISCPLCEFSFGDSRVTDDDGTPYAIAYSHETPGWRAMLEWIWLASAGRLKHLALMRASMASRRFARLNLTLIVLAAVIAHVAQVGFHRARLQHTEQGPAVSAPSGDGWHLVAGLPRPLPSELPIDTPTDVWWNSLQFFLGLGLALPISVLAVLIGMGLLRWGVNKAHHESYRPEQRMTAGLHYSTAWALPVFAGGLVAGLRPLAEIAQVAKWSWFPPVEGVVLTAAVVAGFGAVMWWVWLIRLGATAPAKTRVRVLTFFAAGVPLILAALGTGVYFGATILQNVLAGALRLTFD
jgi:hypothetical protein